MTQAITQSAATDPEHHPPTEPEVDGRRLPVVPAPPKRARSGGPRTHGGKLKSSKNAMKAGIFSKSPVVGDEQPEDWEALRQGLWDHFQPVGYHEEMLVDQIALNRQQMARLNRSMNGIVRHQFDALHQVDRHTLTRRFVDLPPDEAVWFFGGDPESALEALDALKMDAAETALEFYQVEPFLLALTISCDLDPNFRWPCVPAGQEVGDVEGWNVGLVRQCLEAAAAQCKKEPERVIKEAREEVKTAMFHQHLRRRTSEHRGQLRADQALLPPDKELEKSMRYMAAFDKQYDRLMRHLENSQRARANSLPPPIRIDIQET
jgi:hypothetical protein